MKALKNLLTMAGAVSSTAFTFYALRTWGGIYLPEGTALGLAFAGSMGVPWFLNKLITRSYRHEEPDASELGSLFGTTCAYQALVIPLLLSGWLGAAPTIASREAARDAAVAGGIILADREAELATFPMSRSYLRAVWAPNCGTSDRPQVIARDVDGRLRALNLGPTGSELETKVPCIVGPVDTKTGEVILVPRPGQDFGRTELRLDYSGGQVRFLFQGGRLARLEMP